MQLFGKKITNPADHEAHESNSRSADSQGKKCCPDDNIEGTQMFVELQPALMQRYCIELTLKGSFSCCEGKMLFSVNMEEKRQFILNCHCNKRILPIVDLLDGKCIEATGIVSGKVLQVLRIRVVEDIFGDTLQLQTLLNRACGVIEADAIVTDQALLRRLYEIVKDDLTAEMRYWVQGSLTALSSELGDTAKRHICNALIRLLNIDWRSRKPKVPPLPDLQKKLNERFFGLEPVKKQLLEVAAVIRQREELPKYGILLNGPAGVGKTSIANAVADMFGMPKAYLDFSAICDIEGLTGSSRIYSNARPGAIIEQIYRCKSSNIVMILNEIDKCTSNGTKSGSPQNALLSLLDGTGYTDNFMECAIPTENILFIATCNDAELLSGPLLDRFYRIDIPAYSTNEKEMILKQMILPRYQKQEPGFICAEDTCRSLAREYAPDMGVRNLEKSVERLYTNYLMIKELQGKKEYVYHPEDLKQVLGLPRLIRRTVSIVPGVVKCGYVRDSSPELFTINALIRKGDGRINVFGSENTDQDDFCKVAIAYLQTVIPELKKWDILLQFDRAVFCEGRNCVGFAAAAAVISALSGIAFSDTIFVGGCDLHGILYIDEHDLSPLSRMAKEYGNVIFAPAGTSEIAWGINAEPNQVLMEFNKLRMLMRLSSTMG